MTHAAPAANPNLPANIAALRALVLATRAERDAAVAERNEAAAERDALATQNDRLRHLLVKRKRSSAALLPLRRTDVLGRPGSGVFELSLWMTLSTTRRVSCGGSSC